MLDKVYVGSKVQSMVKKGEFAPVSRVTLWRDEDTSFTAGDDTGRHLEYDHRGATQEMADNMYKQLKGFVYRPYEAKGVELPFGAELGDAVTVAGLYSIIAQMDIQYGPKFYVNIGAPGELELGHEFPYLDPVQRELMRRVKLGKSYYGTKITKKDGLVIEKTDGETVSAKAVFNADELSFYASGNRVLYFDPASGTYKFLGELNVADNFIVDKLGNVTMKGSVTIDGSLEMTGSSNWLLTRYSTNKNASIPFDWQEAWNEAWSNTSTQVWAIYSYNGGRNWTQPMLAQGKDGAQGATGPQGSAANVPAWVKAYTESAEFNTLVTDQWVVSMNLFGSKIFGGEFYDAAGQTKLVLNPSKSHLGVADLILYGGGAGIQQAFSIYDNIGSIVLSGYGVNILTADAATEKVYPGAIWDFTNYPPVGIKATFD